VFISSRRRHTRSKRDWSSDVCSSDLPIPGPVFRAMGITTDAIRKIVDFKTDITREAMEYITRWPPADTSRIENATGLQFRSGERSEERRVGKECRSRYEWDQ